MSQDDAAPFRPPRILFVPVFGAAGAASLAAGIVIGRGRFLYPFLLIWGAVLLVVAAGFLIALLVARRRGVRQLSPGLLRYLRVNRYVRAAILGVVGAALVVTGLIYLACGIGLGVVILGVGGFASLLAGLSAWNVRRLSRRATAT